MKTVIVAVLALIAGLASALQSSVEGIENCHNKCDKVFDRLQYAISGQANTNTFEYRSCIIGCNRCQRELKDPKLANDTCFDFCKTFDYTKNGIRKGVIEPDKACLMGCVINTCQQICFGGTTDMSITPQNAQFFWGQGGHGCSIKGGLGFVQNPSYGNPDSPVGPGANEAAAQCCTNAFNLCFYNGDKTSTNFANVVLVSQRSCQKFVPSKNVDAICTYFNNPKNCGIPGLVPGGVLP